MANLSVSFLKDWGEVVGFRRISKEDMQSLKMLHILTIFASKCREISCRNDIGIHIHTSVSEVLFLGEFAEPFVK